METPKRRSSAAGLGLVIGGLVLLGLSVGIFLYGSISSKRALEEFDRAPKVEQPVNAEPIVLKTVELEADGAVDFTSWSKKRIQGYKDSLKAMNARPMAVFTYEKLHLRVPVFAGTDDLTLNRGAGWVEGTARPGENGNIGIAAHRDGFFRSLEHVKVGDTVQLDTVFNTATYAVDEIEIVTPDQVSVLDPRAVPSITLITCYPFDYVGPAPRRFIVHAALKGMSGY